MYRGKNVRTKVQYFTYVKHSVHFFTKNVVHPYMDVKRRVKGMYHNALHQVLVYQIAHYTHYTVV